MIGVSDSPSLVERGADRADAPVHHVARRDASAPARACETAVRASSSSVASLSTTPSARRTPQWPWLVYSHRHRSVITSRSGMRVLDRARRELDDALVVPGARALLVLVGRDAEQQHGGDAERVRLAGLLDRVRRSSSRSTPGIAAIGVRAARCRASTNSGWTRCAARRARSRARGRAARAVRRSRRRRVAGKAMAPIGERRSRRSGAAPGARAR